MSFIKLYVSMAKTGLTALKFFVRMNNIFGVGRSPIVPSELSMHSGVNKYEI